MPNAAGPLLPSISPLSGGMIDWARLAVFVVGMFLVRVAAQGDVTAASSLSATFSGTCTSTPSPTYSFTATPAGIVSILPTSTLAVTPLPDAVPPPTYNITTVAGDGTPGYFGDGGAATLAQLRYPRGVAALAGGVFIADNGNNRIRFLNSTTGILSTFAGTGISDPWNIVNPPGLGDGFDSAVAQLAPSKLALDQAGNLYLTCTCRVRVVVRYIISAFAGTGFCSFSGDGGRAVAATLNTPAGLVFDDATSTLYVSDTNSHRVRAIYSNGIIQTVAGSNSSGFSGDGGQATNAKLGYPCGLAVGKGVLYFADSSNNRIRAVNLSNGIISTVAGSGAGFAGAGFQYAVGSYSGDGGLAVLATLNSPLGVLADEHGNMWIADSLNSVIRYIAADTGVISTVAGDGIEGFTGDLTAATSSELKRPSSLAFGVAGTIYVADCDNQRLRLLTCISACSPARSSSVPSSDQASDRPGTASGAGAAVTVILLLLIPVVVFFARSFPNWCGFDLTLLATLCGVLPLPPTSQRGKVISKAKLGPPEAEWGEVTPPGNSVRTQLDAGSEVLASTALKAAYNPLVIGGGQVFAPVPVAAEAVGENAQGAVMSGGVRGERKEAGCWAVDPVTGAQRLLATGWTVAHDEVDTWYMDNKGEPSWEPKWACD